MSRVVMVVTLFTASISIGCDYSSYVYDARGSLKFADGRPANDVTIIGDSPYPEIPKRPVSPADFATRHFSADYLKEHATFTDSEGRFRIRWVGGDMYSGFNFCPPPAPTLQELYLWIKGPSEWSPITVKANGHLSTKGYPGGRHFDLPPVILPNPTTIPS